MRIWHSDRIPLRTRNAGRTQVDMNGLGEPGLDQPADQPKGPRHQWPSRKDDLPPVPWPSRTLRRADRPGDDVVAVGVSPATSSSEYTSPRPSSEVIRAGLGDPDLGPLHDRVSLEFDFEIEARTLRPDSRPTSPEPPRRLCPRSSRRSSLILASPGGALTSRSPRASRHRFAW